MTSYAYRAGTMTKPQTWRLEGDVLHGPNVELDLRDVTGGEVYQVRTGRLRTRQVVLRHEYGAVPLSTNQRIRRGAVDPEHESHLALVRAVAATLARVAPEARFALGRPAWMSWLVAGPAVALILLGLSIGVPGLDRGDPAVLLPAAVVIAVGAALLWTWWPRGQRTASAEALVEDLSRWRA